MEAEAVVRRYLKVFESGEIAALADLVAEDVEIWGAGVNVVGRSYVQAAVQNPGLSDCRMEILELFAAQDRVSVYFRNTYRHDATGRDLTQTGLKMYQVRDGRIVRFWGGTDLSGLLRQLDAVPAEVTFA